MNADDDNDSGGDFDYDYDYANSHCVHTKCRFGKLCVMFIVRESLKSSTAQWLVIMLIMLLVVLVLFWFFFPLSYIVKRDHFLIIHVHYFITFH